MVKKNPKIITFYLPQFHDVPENNNWWGEGFTDWDSAKAAKPLFKDHYQPRCPIDHDYYNLLDKSTMLKQQQFMGEYGIYGQCIYHYWFKAGRQILEKPAENLLNWKDINMSYCFCWPVESWARTWSGRRNYNSWAPVFENKTEKNNGDGILLEQDFGREEEWVKHFDYLLPFFRDDRYIKKDGKPVFLIHKIELIDCIDEMSLYWQMLAKEAGFPGLFIIGSYGSGLDDGVYNKRIDAYYYHQPLHGRQLSGGDIWKEGICCLDYDNIWRTILKEYSSSENDKFPGAFVDFDNTPRMGNGGALFYNAIPEKFRKYLAQLVWLAKKKGQEFIFLNAWNEWGEGMYLEPDEKFGYAYLSAVREALNNPIEYEDKEDEDVLENEIKQLKQINERYRSYWQIFDKWMRLKELGLCLSDWFYEHNISHIAIYGTGMMARHLIEELRESSVNILFGIDRQSITKHFEFPVYDLREEWPEESRVDVIVVTTTYDNEDIKTKIRDRSDMVIDELTSIIDEIRGSTE